VRLWLATALLCTGACGRSNSADAARSKPTNEVSAANAAVHAASRPPAPAGFTVVQVDSARRALGDGPLLGATASLDELGRRVVAGLNVSDREALESLLVTGGEYKGRLFLTLANHPSALKLGPDASWDMTSRETRDDLRHALDQYGGRDLTFVRVEPAAVDERAGLTVYRRPKIVAQTSEGEQIRLVLLGSVVEHQATGTFKPLSYRDSP
jgi:hypothetical protein